MRRSFAPWSRTALAIAGSALLSSVATAQTAHGAYLGQNACLDTVSAGAMTRVAVYLHPTVHDTSAAAINAAGLLAQDIAAALRPMLGDTTSPVPAAEPRLQWRHVTGFLQLVLYRNGRHRLRAYDFADSAMNLVARALERLTPDAEADLVPTPGPDSLPITLTFAWPTVDRAGHVHTVAERPLIPAFTIAYPWFEPVAPLKVVEPAYPSHPRARSVEGTVFVTFVVDTSGRAVDSTFVDAWPAGRPRPTGDAADWYRDFVRAVRESVARSRYSPARIGGCPVPQVVRQPAAFRLGR